MDKLQPDTITILFLSLGILLATARLLGELAQRLRQPTVLGELLAGVLLGPTVLGTLMPGLNGLLFPARGPVAEALHIITSLAVTLFLLIAGLEVDLSNVWRKGLTGFKVGVAAIVIPFGLTFALVGLRPDFFGLQSGVNPLVFTLFLAIAMSISALPVIVKTLRDLGMYRSDFGVVVVSAAIFNDLVGWVIFAVILGLMDNSSTMGHGITLTVTLALGFIVILFTLGRQLIHRVLPFVQAYTAWPAGEIGFVVILALLGASFTEWIGIHAIFGAFFVGMAVGDSPHLRRRTRYIVDQFVTSVFSPFFFASIGLKVNFVSHFNGNLILLVLTLACVSKLLGGALGARWGKMSGREALAAGFAMNSRGVMEIILGLLALERGIIHQELFVALVITAILTSMMGGPAIQLILHPRRKMQLEETFRSRLFLPALKATTLDGVIGEMTAMTTRVLQNELPAERVSRVSCVPGEVSCTMIVNGAVLLAGGVAGIKRPLVATGICRQGVPLTAGSDQLGRVFFLILTPQEQSGLRDNVAGKLAFLYRDQYMIVKTVQARSFTEFLALIRSTAIYLKKE